MQSITISYTQDSALIRAASLSWIERPVWWKPVLGGVAFGLVMILVVRFGLRFNPDTSHFVAVLIGATTILAFWQISHLRQLRHITDAAMASDSTVTVTFDANGIRTETENSTTQMGWPAVSGITAFSGGTGLRISASVLGVPDSAIADQMTPAVFRDRLTKWREAAA